MPRYENDPTKVTASFEVLPKDDYEFIVGEPKSFYRINNAGNPSYGVRYPLTVGSGPMQGKKSSQVCYEQSEGAIAMGKQFRLAVLGYDKGRSEEQRFDKDYAGKDWAFDTDDNSVGDAWRELTGKRVVGSFDVAMGTNGEEQQDVKGWRKI